MSGHIWLNDHHSQIRHSRQGFGSITNVSSYFPLTRKQGGQNVIEFMAVTNIAMKIRAFSSFSEFWGGQVGIMKHHFINGTF